MSIEQVQEAINKALQRVAPAWTLENSVAVNPYLGLADTTFEKAAELLKYRGDIDLYMPLGFYAQQIEEGRINNADIRRAMSTMNIDMSVREFRGELDYLKGEKAESHSMKTLLNLAQSAHQNDLHELLVNHTSEWLSSFFREEESGSPEEMWAEWKRYSETDLLPELSGLENFRSRVKNLPENAHSAILNGLENLHLKEHLVEAYLHALLLKLVGWSSYASGIDWQNRLYGGEINYQKTLLAIIISWENILIQQNHELEPDWKEALNTLEDELSFKRNNEYFQTQAVLQLAFDLAAQRELRKKFSKSAAYKSKTNKDRPKAQMVFCIDVRSEVYRRNLETVDNEIETIGFAGFFGFPIKYSPINHSKGRNNCPVLIPSGPEVCEHAGHNHDAVEQKIEANGKLNTAWSKFKTGAVSSFSFVSPLGLFYLPKLIGDSLGWSSPAPSPKEKEFGQILKGDHKLDVTGIPFEDRVTMAKSALTAMGLSNRMAPVVLIAGHGSTSVNNPHASGLDCGACGGNSGEINALTAEIILNDKAIRQQLDNEGIHIPRDTRFVACLHDTTTDEIKILNEAGIATSHNLQMDEIKKSLALASQSARKTRAPRLGVNLKSSETEIMRRANDWSQVRPEWGLAGCNSFVVAPRFRTASMDLESKTFLHSYDWRSDKEYAVLETIMTAPMVVTSWINLQYYASTADNNKLGAGNKTLHNVTAGLGVLEGSNGDLRIGLPMQSIHDGEKYQHLPQRLNVVIEAPVDAVNNIIQKHEMVRDLCDNNWITILLLDEEGKISQKYVGNGEWERLEERELQTEIKEYQTQTI